MKSIKKIFLIIISLFLLIQLYQPARNIDYGQVSSVHFVRSYNVPRGVQHILEKSCYDCHSNQTAYPWYSYIQPVRMFLEDHIKEGKEELNFSEWGNYSRRKQRNKLEGILKQVKENEMPLSSYTVIHKNAVLSENQKTELANWINSINKDE
jgi:hypothetical protein